MSSTATDKPIEPPVCAGQDLNTKKPDFTLPPGATDCHAHMFGPRHGGYAPDRFYSPPQVFLQDYLNMLAVLGISALSGAIHDSWHQ